MHTYLIFNTLHRGWLDEEETCELMAMLQEADCSLHGVIAAAGLLAVSRYEKQIIWYMKLN